MEGGFTQKIKAKYICKKKKDVVVVVITVQQNIIKRAIIKAIAIHSFIHSLH